MRLVVVKPRDDRDNGDMAKPACPRIDNLQVRRKILKMAAKEPHEHSTSNELWPKTVAEFFAGIGLMRMGLERAGWNTVFANDIDPLTLPC